MPFVQKFNTLLYSSNNNVAYIDTDPSLTITILDNNLNIISSKQIYKNSSSFVNYYFDIDHHNNIYGLLNDNINGLQYINIGRKNIIKNILINYNIYENHIKFPYIKKINNVIHIFYYLINTKDNHSCCLVHYYKTNFKWQNNIVDNIDFNILTNFRVIETPSNIIIFYFKIIDGYEELFMKLYDIKNNTWSKASQITNTHNQKLYLSVIKDAEELFHIAYSENHSEKYQCCYINGYIDTLNHFKVESTSDISQSIVCTFPTLLYYNKILYFQWIEYDNLNFKYSNNNGYSWSKQKIDDISLSQEFSCFRLGSNISNTNIIYSFFSQKNFINVLGVLKEPNAD